MIDLGWAKAEFTKSPEQVVIDGITTAVNAPTANVKATNLITLNAHINNAISGISIQAAASIAPGVHDAPTPATV
jgi:hypothetical protein